MPVDPALSDESLLGVTVSSVRACRQVNRLPHRGQRAVTVSEDRNDSSKRKVHGCSLSDPDRVKWNVITRRCGIELGTAFQIDVVSTLVRILTVGFNQQVNNQVSSIASGVLLNVDSRRSGHGDRLVIDARESRNIECAAEIRRGVRSRRACEKENQSYRQNGQAALCAVHRPSSRRDTEHERMMSCGELFVYSFKRNLGRRTL